MTDIHKKQNRRLKVLFIREYNKLYRYSNTSYGLGLIGTLAKEFAEVRILDNNSAHTLYTHRDIVHFIAEFNPDIIGFSVNAFNIYQTSKLVPVLKQKFPEKCLIAGGLHTFSKPKEVADLGVHVVVKGEAELVIAPLLQALQGTVDDDSAYCLPEKTKNDLREIPGLLFADSASDTPLIDTGNASIISDLDTLPFVDYSLFNLQDYLKGTNDFRHVVNVVITQRGCPFKCPFCHIKNGGGMNVFRENSIAYRVRYVQHLYDLYHPRYIIFYDENFTLKRDETIQFCLELIASGLNEKLNFFCLTNVVNPFDDELLSLLKKAGFTEVSLGIERLNPDALAQIQKNRDYETIVHNVKMLKKHGIDHIAQALIGFPFDTREMIEEEQKLFNAISGEVKAFVVNNLLPLPGTKIYEETRYKGWYLDKKIMEWEPSFYHLIHGFVNPAWDVNFFDLDNETQTAIRKMKEAFQNRNITRSASVLIRCLRMFENFIAKFSLFLYKISPFLEKVVFFLPKFARMRLWNYLVSKYHRKEI